MKRDLEGIGNFVGSKLRLLRAATPGREWRSLAEKRHCILCERDFTGNEVRLARGRRGVARLACPTPGCIATPAEWVHPGNPLLSEEAWRDWVRLLDSLCDEEGASRRPVRRFRPRADGPRAAPLWGA